MNIVFFMAAYLLGSIPTALLIGKKFYGIDIREYGSNNPGATNTTVVLGKKAGFIVLLVDVGKGALAASLPFLFQVDIDPLKLGLVAVIGHCFPIFAHFRGGKAIATTAGTLLVAHPFMFLFTYIIFFAIIYLTKYGFIGSISVGFSLFIYSTFEKNLEYQLIFSLFIVLLIYLHRSNIRNFKNNTEPRINDKNILNQVHRNNFV